MPASTASRQRNGWPWTKMGTGMKFIVSIYRDQVARGTLRVLIAKAGLTIEEFLAAAR